MGVDQRKIKNKLFLTNAHQQKVTSVWGSQN